MIPPSPESPLRIALVGAGTMGRHHAQAIGRTSVPARLIAVADPVATGTGLDASTPRYPDLGSLLEHESIDVVHIVTPPATHLDLALQAVRYGAHVYVEKPFTPTREAALQILNEASHRQVSVCAGHQLLTEHPSSVLFGLLPSLGNLVHVESYFAFRTVRRASGGRAPLQADLQLLDILPHPVYMLVEALQRATGSEPSLEALQVDPRGTVHALLRSGPAVGALVVTLTGRPVDSYLRLVGTNGMATADYVRGTVQRHLGPGISGIDKLVIPYRQARQLLWGTTRALAARLANRRRSYPGLGELIDLFYGSVVTGAPSPVSPTNILTTAWLCEEVTKHLAGNGQADPPRKAISPSKPSVLVTGGTGFLGREVIRALRSRGHGVRSVGRRRPPPWEVIDGVDYVIGDLGTTLDPSIGHGIGSIIHCAAETAGSWGAHQRNSIDATEHLIRLAAAGGIQRFIQVSSVAVLDDRWGMVRDATRRKRDPRRAGPYVWGKLMSEERALALGKELGVDVKVVRPGPIIDEEHFEPPGRLGKRLANIYVAAGTPWQRLAVVDVQFAGRLLAWTVDHWDQLPSPINLLNPSTPTRKELVGRLKADNPDLTVVWLPTSLIHVMSWGGILIQKMLRPRQEARSIAGAFVSKKYDVSSSRSLQELMTQEAS